MSLFFLLAALPYSFGAPLYSLVSLLTAWTYRDYVSSTMRGVSADLPLFGRVVYPNWLRVKVVMAAIQLPVHLSLLLPRINSAVGQALLRDVDPVAGYSIWSHLVWACNVALILWTIVHQYMAIRMRREHLADDDDARDSTMMAFGGVRRANQWGWRLYQRLVNLETVGGVVLVVVLSLRLVIRVWTGSFVTIATQ